MFLAGLQKLSLLDYPGLVACTLFTQGCNLRCPFCHNAGLVLPEEFGEQLDTDEVLAFLENRRRVLDGVCVTGGEPLIHNEIVPFFRRIREMGYRIKLDTNGFFPERLQILVNEGLIDYVAMDIKNGPSYYAATVGIPVPKMDAVEESKNFLLSGVVDYELRTTVVRGLHTKESLMEAARWIRGTKVWYLQQFRDSGAILSNDGLSAFSEEEMRQLLAAVRELIPGTELRGL